MYFLILYYNLLYFFGYKTEFFLPKQPKNLDPAY